MFIQAFQMIVVFLVTAATCFGVVLVLRRLSKTNVVFVVRAQIDAKAFRIAYRLEKEVLSLYRNHTRTTLGWDESGRMTESLILADLRWKQELTDVVTAAAQDLALLKEQAAIHGISNWFDDMIEQLTVDFPVVNVVTTS